MATKKNRSLAGFGEVANENEPRPTKQINTNKNINTNVNTNNNVIDNILEPTDKKELVGVYFEPHLVRILDQLAGKKRGAKSAIVNEALRRLLQEKGLL